MPLHPIRCMINMSKLSENLKELMEERELNQTTLAEKLDTGRTKLSDILNAKNTPGYHTFVALIEFFHCSADFLLGLKEYPCEETTYKIVPPFQDRLRTVFRETDKSQYSFIKETKTSWSVLHGWLNGKTSPSMDSLVKTAAFFGCSVDFLLGRI